MNSLDKDCVILDLPSIAHIIAQDDDVLVLQTHTALSGQVASGQEPSSQSQSQPPMPSPSYGGFNLGLHVGDKPQHVHQNRSQLLAAINQYLTDQGKAPLRELHWLNQVHGNTVMNVEVQPPTMRAIDADAMVSQATQCGLAIMTADCVPIVLYQPSSGKIAAIHAGWQGLANGIIAETAATFAGNTVNPTHATNTSNPDHQVLAWIGACISQANYEVGGEVVDKLMAGCASRQGLSAIESNQLRASICKKAENTANRTANTAEPTDKYWLDLPKLARLQLEAQGIRLADDSEIPCSYADAHYYSYRQQTHEGRPATGRMALVIVRL